MDFFRELDLDILKQRMMQQWTGSMDTPNESHFYSRGGLKSDNRYSSNQAPISKSDTISNDKNVENKSDTFPGNEDAKTKVLFLEKLPLHLANPDSVHAIFETLFGKVDKVKMLAKQPTTALVQMETENDAKRAVLEQDKLKKLGGTSNTFVKFCTNVKEIKIGREDDRSKDYTRKGGSSNNMLHSASRGVPFGMNNGFFRPPSYGLQMNGGYNDAMMMQNQFADQSMGCCLFVSRLPEDITNPDSICNLLGVYGDVYKVQMIKNSSALVEMATPMQASNVKNYLDQVKIGDNKVIVSHSNKPGLRQMNENNDKFKDYTRARIHRFQGLKPGHKMLKTFYRPSAELFVSRFEAGKSENIKKYFEESGYTVKDVKNVGQKGDMAIVTLDSVEQGVKALAKLHNTMPEELGEKKGKRGLTLNFAMSSNKKRNFKNTETREESKPKEDVDMEDALKIQE